MHQPVTDSGPEQPPGVVPGTCLPAVTAVVAGWVLVRRAVATDPASPLWSE